MSSRKTGYRISVMLLAFVFSIPFVAVGTWLILELYSGPILRIPLPFDGLHYVVREFGKRTDFPNQISTTFWNERYVHAEAVWQKTSGQYGNFLRWKDSETGAEIGREFATMSIDHLQSFVAGDRIWLVGDRETYEFVDGKWQKSSLDLSTARRWWGAQPIVWNGELVFVRQITPNNFSVVHFAEGVWQAIGTIVLPKSNQQAALKNAQTQNTIKNSLKCFNRGDQIHFLLKQDGDLFYREGLVVDPESSQKNGAAELATEDKNLPPETRLAGWSRFTLQTALPDDFEFVGMFIEGQLAIMIIEGLSSATPVGRVYRFDGTDWVQFASQPLPLGSLSFRAESTRDGMGSHFKVATSIGAMQTYMVDATGIRKTNGLKSNFSFFPMRVVAGCLMFAAIVIGDSLLLGMFLALGTWYLMRRHTRPDYEFGMQTVKLASLGWRSFARFIDLTIICVTTAALARQLILNFDWLSLFESLNMGIDHPTILNAKRIAMLVMACPIMLGIAIVVTQAVWGITPGKWLCRLRTLRTNLRPCGFAASLTREAVFFVDCCNFLCWTPGIVSIALTEQRQRLGDLVADTIVVESQSIGPTIT